jgi:hypothetical protein
MNTVFQVGDFVVYHKHKFSPHPGPNAQDVSPAPNGDDYSFCIDKFWRVIAVGSGREVVVRTRRGKVHTLSAEDPALRKARWWERVFLRHRFPVDQPRESTTPG